MRWLAHKSGSHSRGADVIGNDVPLEADHRQPVELEPVKASESQSGSSLGASPGSSGGMPGVGIQLAAFVVSVVVDHPAEDGTRHGRADLPARRPSRPTRPACTAPVTAPARTPHGSLHGPPRLLARLITAFCRAVQVGLPRLARRSFPPRFAGQIFLPGFPPVRRSCDDYSQHGSCTAFHGLFTALPGARRGAVVGPRRRSAWDRRLKPCKNLQTYGSGTPRPASREALP